MNIESLAVHSKTQSDEYNRENLNIDKNTQLVSVVLATYNGEKYLSQQLDSLLQQTYKNIEIVAVDDGSSDTTVQILLMYAKTHNNLKVFKNEMNLGFIKNFEKGCTLCSGEYIALCDHDDFWEATKIEKMVKAIDTYSLVFCDSLVCDDQLQPNGVKVSQLVTYQSWNNCLQLAVFCRIYAHAMLFKRALLETAFPFLEIIPPDWWLPYLATLQHGIKYLDEPLVLYRQHSSNVSGVIHSRRKKAKKINRSAEAKLEKAKIRTRINAFYNACPAELQKEKKVLLSLKKSYESFSLANNLRRVSLFLHYRNIFLAVKKHTLLHRFLFCFKMFFKIK